MSTHALSVPLTDEQARLYRESPHFKAAVDAFLAGVLPPFLEGVAARSARVDADVEARCAEVERLVAEGDWPTINQLLRDGWATKRQVKEADFLTDPAGADDQVADGGGEDVVDLMAALEQSLRDVRDDQ